MRYISIGFKSFLLVIALLLSSVNVAYAYSQPIGIDGIAAVVNDGIITNQQLATKIAFAKQQLAATNSPLPPAGQLRQQVLQHLIEVQLQLQVAKKMGIKIDDATVDKAIAQIATRNNITLDQLKAQITQQGMNYDQYRQEIKEEMTLNAVEQKSVAPRVRITDQQVTDFLNIHHNVMPQLTQPSNVQYHVQIIFIPLTDAATPEQIADATQGATEALNQLRAGADIQQMSISKIGVQYDMQEADLGWRPLAQIPDVYQASLKNLQAGGYAGPIKAPNGIHIIRLVGTQGQQSAFQQATQEYHVRHILLKTTPMLSDGEVEARLNQMRTSILDGTGNFAQLATQNSQDPGSAGSGGDLGWVTSDGLDPQFAKVMAETKVGEISAPFKSQFGWHILQVLGSKEITNKQELLRSQAKLYIYQQKFNETMQTWLQGLKSASYIKIN